MQLVSTDIVKITQIGIYGRNKNKIVTGVADVNNNDECNLTL